jgi:hypothetical protein
MSLRDAHARLMAQRDEVDTAFKGIDAAVAAIPATPRAPARPARPRRPRLPHPIPKGLPPADALPCPASPRWPPPSARPTFAPSAASPRSPSCGLVAGADDERGGARRRGARREGGALRECSRLIGVAQPLAGAWLRAIPGPSQFRLRSSLYVIALQVCGGSGCRSTWWRRRPTCGAAAETLGDELLKGCEHTTRHNRVVAAWVRAVQAARGAAHTRATAEAPACGARRACSTSCRSTRGRRAHTTEAGEVKVYNTTIATTPSLLTQPSCFVWCDPGLRRDARAAAHGEPQRVRAE